MDDGEFKKYVELIMSMCTDYLMGEKGLEKKTFISNLQLISRKLGAEYIVEKYDSGKSEAKAGKPQ